MFLLKSLHIAFCHVLSDLRDCNVSVQMQDRSFCSPACPEGGKFVDGLCYGVVSLRETRGQEKAELACQSFAARLSFETRNAVYLYQFVQVCVLCIPRVCFENISPRKLVLFFETV